MIELKKYLEYKLATTEDVNISTASEWIAEFIEIENSEKYIQEFKEWEEEKKPSKQTDNFIQEQKDFLKGSFVNDYPNYSITLSERAVVGDFIKFGKHIYEIQAIAKIENFIHLCFIDDGSVSSFTEGAMGITILKSKQ